MHHFCKLFLFSFFDSTHTCFGLSTCDMSTGGQGQWCEPFFCLLLARLSSLHTYINVAVYYSMLETRSGSGVGRFVVAARDAPQGMFSCFFFIQFATWQNPLHLFHATIYTVIFP